MKRTLLISAVAVGLMALPSPASAQQKCGEIPTVLIIQDRSGSMKELVGAKSKWDIARQALSNIANQFGNQLSVGLMLYPRWPDKGICDAGLVNVAPVIKNQLNVVTTLNKVVPAGNTPLAASLDAAAAYLKTLSASLVHIILVTDGKETCLLPSKPLTKPGSCQWKSGTNYRKCGGCGWQFCLAGGTWSNVCAAKPSVHPCPAGQTCDSKAKCTGAATGSLTAKQAMANLAAVGVTGHVIGFGANVDAAVLKDLASAGGTTNYQYAANPAGLQSALNKIVAGINCCGNGALDKGELCDKKIAAGQPGACPTSCNDGKPCTADKLTGSDCSVKCQYTPITQPKNGDGCCPPGANSGNDNDCKASCGNGVLDVGEKCDPGIPKGQTGACDLKCDDKDPCTTDILGGSKCNPVCTTKPVAADPTQKDQCCPKTPAKLTVKDDPDCPPPCGPGAPDGGPCVDLCKGVKCPAGHYCKQGKCLPFPVDMAAPRKDLGGDLPTQGFQGTGGEVGCDCRVGGGGSGLPAAGLLLLALGLLRRRRR